MMNCLHRKRNETKVWSGDWAAEPPTSCFHGQIVHGSVACQNFRFFGMSLIAPEMEECGKAGAMPQKCEWAEKLGQCPRKTADDR